MKRKLQKKDKISLGILAALIVIVIGAGAFMIINNTKNANKQTEKITSGSQSASSENNSSKASKNSDSQTSSGKKTSNTKSGKKPYPSSSSSSASSSSKASSKTSSKVTKSSKVSSEIKVEGDKIKRVKPKENTSHASSNELKVNGKTCYVGDTINIVMNITSQKSIVNYQGILSFDSKYLKIKNAKSNSIGVANSNDNQILYNASSINGMDFSETGTVFTATFEVKQAGSTKVSNNLEIISELINNNIKQLSESDYKVNIDIYS